MNIEEAKEQLKDIIRLLDFRPKENPNSSLELERVSQDEWKEVLETVLSELEKKETIIERYEIECKRFRKFCSKIRKTKKRNVDEFNQGQEHKCNQFLNLLAGEENWEFDGKYFDETDKEINKVEREGK